MNKFVRMAIDKHCIPRYDKTNRYLLIHTESKKGTNWFEAYATLQIVGEERSRGANMMSDGVQLTGDDKNVEFVRKFIQTIHSINLLVNLMLPDREFFTVDVMESISASGMKFLMPAVKRTSIKRAILEHHNELRNSISRYMMTSAEGRTFEFTLLIKPVEESKRKDGEELEITDLYVVYATNLSANRAQEEEENLPEEYRKRWNIETGYKNLEQVRPKTLNRNHLFRIILFFISMYIYRFSPEYKCWLVSYNLSS